MSKNVIRIIPTFLLAVGADMATKVYAASALPFNVPQPVAGELFRLRLVFNDGIAFGLFATMGSGVTIVTSLATLLLVAWLLYALRREDGRLPAPWAVGLLLGGAIGNFLDRLVDGRVTDFLDFGIGAYRFATFNLADVFLLVGVGMLTLHTYTNRPSEKET